MNTLVKENNINDDMSEDNKSKDNKNTKRMDVFLVVAGLVFLFDASQKIFYLVFGDGNSKAEKTDNKELNKKNEKKLENAFCTKN